MKFKTGKKRLSSLPIFKVPEDTDDYTVSWQSYLVFHTYKLRINFEDNRAIEGKLKGQEAAEANYCSMKIFNLGEMRVK